MPVTEDGRRKVENRAVFCWTRNRKSREICYLRSCLSKDSYDCGAKNKDDEDEDKDKDDAGARASPLLTSRPLKQGLLMAAGEDIQIFVHVLKYTKSNINRTFPNSCTK